MMTETVVTVDAPHHNNAAKPDAGTQGHAALSWIRINVEYFKTIPGILKIIQLILGILCMACASPARLSGTHWFLFVATTSFIVTLLWVVVYFLGVREALKIPVNWILSELVNTGIWTVLYAIAFIVQLIVWSPNYVAKGPNVAAGVFGLFNTLAYAAGTYFLHVEWKNNGGNNP